jgi:hypothetical protein
VLRSLISAPSLARFKDALNVATRISVSIA